MGSTRRSFTEEYKDQAVAFVIEGNRSVADVARNIGVHEMTLGKWVKKTRDSQREQIPPDAELTGSERLELIRLRAELKDEKATIAELQMQVEFAKKVATWFAKGKQCSLLRSRTGLTPIPILWLSCASSWGCLARAATRGGRPLRPSVRRTTPPLLRS